MFQLSEISSATRLPILVINQSINQSMAYCYTPATSCTYSYTITVAIYSYYVYNLMAIAIIILT